MAHIMSQIGRMQAHRGGCSVPRCIANSPVERSTPLRCAAASVAIPVNVIDWPDGQRPRRETFSSRATLRRLKVIKLREEVERLGGRPAASKEELINQLWDLVVNLPTAAIATATAAAALPDEAEQPGSIEQQELRHSGITASTTLGENTTGLRPRIEIKGAPSLFCKPLEAEPYVHSPDDLDPNCCLDAAFLGNRPFEATLCSVIAATSVAPEFGLIRDAAYCNVVEPTPYFYQAAVKLVDRAACMYPNEGGRQDIFVQWVNETYPGLPFRVISPLAATTDGLSGLSQMATRASGDLYSVLLIEAKDELGVGGDPQFQAMRYYQILNDRLLDSDWLDTTASPAIGLMMVGPFLWVTAMYTNSKNQVAFEHLTPVLPLLSTKMRQPHMLQLLARALTAVGIGVWNLMRRIETAAGSKGLSWAFDDVTVAAVHRQKAFEGLEVQANLALQQIRNPAGVSYTDWLEAVRWTSEQLQSAAAARGQDDRAWPYCLWAGQQSIQLTDIRQVDRQTVNPIYRAKCGAKEEVLIKIMLEPYPWEVHEAAAAADLAPTLLHHEQLPGGNTLIVMEWLDHSKWHPLATVLNASNDAHALIVPAVCQAVHKFHGLRFQSVSGKEDCMPVHGDLRPPNIMVEFTGGGGYHVKFIDFDEAGIAGVDRYRIRTVCRSAAISWHPDVKPGQLVQQEHDWHVLRSYVSTI